MNFTDLKFFLLQLFWEISFRQILGPASFFHLIYIQNHDFLGMFDIISLHIFKQLIHLKSSIFTLLMQSFIFLTKKNFTVYLLLMIFFSFYFFRFNLNLFIESVSHPLSFIWSVYSVLIINLFFDNLYFYDYHHTHILDSILINLKYL